MKPGPLLGTGLLLAVLVALTTMTWHAAPDSPLQPRPLPACLPGGPAIQHVQVQPLRAGEITTAPLNASLYATSALSLRTCQAGTLSLTATGQGANHWGPQLSMYRNGRLLRTQDIQGQQVLTLPVKSGDHLTLAFTNDLFQLSRRYITVTRLKGPWCPDNPGYAEPGAWMRPSGDYGDITGGGTLYFRTCQSGKAQFRIEGIPEQNEPPTMQLQVSGHTIQTRPVTGRTLLQVNTTESGTIAFTVLNPSRTAGLDRKLYLKDIHIQ